MKLQSGKAYILIADDNPIDHSLIARALKEAGVEDEIRWVKNGKKLIEALKYQTVASVHGEHSKHPSLILLDLNMPLMDGREALKIIKTDSELKLIPTVILTSSITDEDVNDSYRHGANSVLTKPTHFKELVALMDLVRAYWLRASELPFLG